MNTILWVLQIFMAILFGYSGFCKSVFSITKLVQIGQTGPASVPIGFVRFIGIAELLGSVGIILPWLLTYYAMLTPIAATCFAFIMPFAAYIHYKRKEYKNILTNVLAFLICIFIAVMRFKELH